ncbi:hypothetical protein DV736_g3482, partial [Chaetothyriales sp. CBS 134916]
MKPRLRLVDIEDLKEIVSSTANRMMSIYVEDEEDYIPIVVNNRRNQGGNRIYLAPSVARPRAASQGGQAQPINLTVKAPSERSHSRSHSRSHHSRKHSDDYYSSDDSRYTRRSKERRRSSRYDPDDIDNLPYSVRKKLEEAEKIKDAEKEKQRAAAAALDKQRWESDLKEPKVREKFKAAGYSDERIDRVLHDKRKSRDDGDNSWAIDLSRPTFIKVSRKYLSPDTLDHFNLPWEWDKKNTEYIVIKKYIDEDFQDVLFEHTRILKLKEKKVLTSGYEKDVTVRLKPTTGVFKDKDQMYVVREKSKSPGRSVSRSRRSSWMFT